MKIDLAATAGGAETENCLLRMTMKSKKLEKKLDRKELLAMLERLPGENFSQNDLDNVASDIASDDNTYLRIAILAKSFNARYIPIFEKFVFSEDDPDVVAMSLRALVDFHGRSDYVPLLVQFIDGVSWDVDDDLKFRGIQISKQILRSSKNASLISHLIKQFEETSEIAVKEAAHEALMAAADIDRAEIATRIAARGMKNDDYRFDVIGDLKKRYAAREG